MIRVFVDVGPLGVQLLGQFDVGVRLDGEGLADGEHLEEEREVIPESRPWEVSLVSGWWDLELQYKPYPAVFGQICPELSCKSGQT